MSKPARLIRAERRVERAQYALVRAHNVLFDAQGAHLTANGWERVWTWPPSQRLWKRGDKTYTTFAAMREQERLEKRRAREATRKARKA